VLPDDLPQRLEPLLLALGPRAALAIGPPQEPEWRGPRRTREQAAMQQAKLVLVYRVPAPRTVAGWCAVQAMANLWGGGPHSRLFREVRERRSLCYYASTAVDAHKGIVLVQVGCDAPAVAAVVEEVERQRQSLASGECTEDEHATAIATIAGSLQAVDDSLGTRLQFTAEQWLCGFDQTPAERQDSYRALDRDAIAAAAAATWLDHEYALVPEATP
jgi:predicted Zn-dependent peptidase